MKPKRQLTRQPRTEPRMPGKAYDKPKTMIRGEAARQTLVVYYNISSNLITFAAGRRPVHFEHGQQTASGADSDAVYQMLEKFGAGQVLVRCWRIARVEETLSRTHKTRTKHLPTMAGSLLMSLPNEGSLQESQYWGSLGVWPADSFRCLIRMQFVRCWRSLALDTCW